MIKMIYYPIETLVEAGIKDILIIVDPIHCSVFLNSLGDGSKFGARFTYATQMNPEGTAQAFHIAEDFLDKDSVCFIIGDCIIIGKNRSGSTIKQSERLKRADKLQYSYVRIMILTSMELHCLIRMVDVRK